MYYIHITYKNRWLKHILFADSVSTRQIIQLAEELLDVVCIDYNATTNSIRCQGNNDFTIVYEYVKSFSFLDFPADRLFTGKA